MNTTTIASISKAIAGALAGAIVLFLAKHNIVIADNLNDALEIVISAVITGAIVYLAPKNKDVQ